MWLPTIQPALLVVILGLICSRFMLKFWPKINGLVWVFAGATLALLHAQLHTQNQLTEPQHLSFDGQLLGLPISHPDRVTFMIKSNDDRRYRLSWYLDADQRMALKTGATYRIVARLKPPHGSVNPVGFDRERWLFRHKIDAIGSIQTIEMVDAAPWYALGGIRQQLKAAIESRFDEPAVRGVILALTLGDRSQLDVTDYQETGTAHLMAISGLHIGLVAGIGWFFGGLLFRLVPSQVWHRVHIKLACGMAFAVLYAYLAGFGISTQRALIMLMIYAWFKLKHHRPNPWDVWVASLVAVLLLDPFNVLDWGFWLSFVAVALLIYGFQSQQQNSPKWLLFIKAQWILLLGLMPVAMWVFGSVKWLAPLSNLVAIPVMGLVLVPMLLLMMLFLLLFGWAPSSLVSGINWVAKLLQQFIQWMGQLSDLNWSVILHEPWQFWILLLGVLWLLAPKAMPQRWLGVLAFLVLLYQPSKQSPPGHFEARFIDVGQGLSVWVSTQNHDLVYDVGARYDSGFNWAEAVVLPLLQKHGVTEVDRLIISHQDNDHAGGQASFLKAMSVKEVLGTETEHTPCTTDESWHWDGVRFEVLSPYNLTPYLKNNSSCVLKISGKHHSLLLTGDIEAAVEYRLTAQTSFDLKSDILLLPHHGSLTSSTEAFIAAVKPQMAINSSGKYNPFGHPKVAVLSRYESLKIPVYDTQDLGMISVGDHPNLWWVSERLQKPRIWRHSSNKELKSACSNSLTNCSNKRPPSLF